MKRWIFFFFFFLTFFFKVADFFFPAKAQWLIFSLFSAQKCLKIFFFSGWNKVFLSRGRGQRFFLSRRLGFVVLREGKIVFVQREVNIFFVQREVMIVFVPREGNIFQKNLSLPRLLQLALVTQDWMILRPSGTEDLLNPDPIQRLARKGFWG